MQMIENKNLNSSDASENSVTASVTKLISVTLVLLWKFCGKTAEC